MNTKVESLFQKYHISGIKTGMERLTEKYIPSIPPPPVITLKAKIENYIDALLKNLEPLKGALQDRFIQRITKDLKEIDTDDDDIDEIMGDIHKTIEDNIYDSLSRVKREHIPKLEKYLQQAGYQPVPVKIGDNIHDFVEYFSSTFPEPTFSASQWDKIKAIDTKPYQKKYTSTDDDEEVLKLRGSCVYYTKKGK